MSGRPITWKSGDERVRSWVEEWIAEGSSTNAQLLHESGRRLLYRLDSRAELSIDSHGDSTTRSVIVKIHRTHSGRHPRRESFKKRIAFSPASGVMTACT